MHMHDWNNYRNQLVAAATGFGKLSRRNIMALGASAGIGLGLGAHIRTRRVGVKRARQVPLVRRHRHRLCRERHRHETQGDKQRRNQHHRDELFPRRTRIAALDREDRHGNSSSLDHHRP